MKNSEICELGKFVNWGSGLRFCDSCTGGVETQWSQGPVSSLDRTGAVL